MSILVSGGAGYIGSHTCVELLNAGYDIVVVDKFDLPDHKTKSAKAILDALKVMERTVLLSMPEYDETTVCATGNLAGVVLRKAQSMNVYEMLRFHKVVFTKDGLDAFIKRLG